MTAATAVATTETTGRDRSAVVAPMARAEHLRDILETREWDQPRFRVRGAVA